MTARLAERGLCHATERMTLPENFDGLEYLLERNLFLSSTAQCKENAVVLLSLQTDQQFGERIVGFDSEAAILATPPEPEAPSEEEELMVDWEETA